MSESEFGGSAKLEGAVAQCGPKITSVVTEENGCVNGRIACAPVPTGPQKKLSDNGLVTMSNQNTLAGAMVLIPPSLGSRDFPSLQRGDIVYFHAALAATAPWAKHQYEVDGENVIFVPQADILMVRRKVTRYI